jgi:stage V sporulation protein G
MEITEVRISVVDDPSKKLRAYANITLDNCFVVRGVKIIEGNSGLFISMPSRKRPDNTYQDVAHPINNETRQMMEQVVIGAYKTELGKERGAELRL